MKIKWLIFTFLMLALSFSSWICWKYLQQETPYVAIEAARKNLALAEDARASDYAHTAYRQARSHFDSAMHHWQAENKKPFYQRDFEKAILNASQSTEFSKQASQKSISFSKNSHIILKKQIDQLNKKVSHFNSYYKNIPMTKEHLNRWMKGKILLEEGTLAYKNKNFLKSVNRLNEAELLINQVFEHPKNVLADYFENLPEWKKQKEELISKTKRQKSTGIIVDKYERKCRVYKSGNLLAEYDVELGSNWIGYKNYQGDKATPEGFYKVIKKKTHPQTKYHKAFLLDYPNDSDKKRFEQAKQNGQIKSTAKIGNLIEIHGHGGKGTDWTDGCVAVTDKIMDILFQWCPEGTEVLIVGSLKPLDDYINTK